MSLLTFCFFWVCLSLIATPFIGAFVGALDSGTEHSGNSRFAETRLRPDRDGFANPALVPAPVLISRSGRRKPMASDFALRTSRRMRR